MTIMALQVVSPAVSVYRVTGVVEGVEQADEYTFHRGELLPDWVSAYQQFVLTQTGMARQVGDFPDPNLQRPEEIPAPTVLPEHDSRHIVGTPITGREMTGERVTAADREKAADKGAATAADRGAGADRVMLPDDAAVKPVWEEFAVRRLDFDRGHAESLRKADLVDEAKKEYGKRYTASGEPKKHTGAGTGAGQADTVVGAKVTTTHTTNLSPDKK